MKKIKFSQLLILILFFAILTRFFNLSHPSKYIFDEVYHAFTANAYAENNPAGYEWWHASPVKGTAYEWLHPPLAKLFMALGILIFGNNSFGWRFFSALFGSFNILLLYFVGKKIFNQKIGLLAAFLACFDGLFLSQSRIAMNDIFLTTFILATIYFLYSWIKTNSSIKIIITFIFAALAASTKWPGIFLIPIIYFALLNKAFKQKRPFNWLKKTIPLFLISSLLVPLIYYLSYAQFWLQGHTWEQFKQLHQQIWWYQTNLKATHDYQSAAWTWPLMLRPVWFWVEYKQAKIANIYNLGNPLIWWLGILNLIFLVPQAIWSFFKKKSVKFCLLIFSYFIFWLPWLFSPRILFLHHYLPALNFLILLLSYSLYQLEKQVIEIPIKIKTYKQIKKNIAIPGKALVKLYLILTALTFILLYPINTGLIAIPKTFLKYFLWLPSWK